MVQDPNQSTVDDMNKVSREPRTHFTCKNKTF